MVVFVIIFDHYNGSRSSLTPFRWGLRDENLHTGLRDDDLLSQKVLEAKICPSSEINEPCHRSSRGHWRPKMKLPKRSTLRQLELEASKLSRHIDYFRECAFFFMIFFPIGFLDLVFSKACTHRSWRKILNNKVWILLPLRVWTSTRSCSTSVT